LNSSSFTALELVGSFPRILHRHRGETAEALRMLGDPLGQRVVDRLRLADRRRGIALALDPRLEQRQHREVDTGLVHSVETQRVDLRQPLGRLAAKRGCRPATLGAPHIGEPLDEDMLLERDLPGHARRSLPPPRQWYARSIFTRVLPIREPRAGVYGATLPRTDAISIGKSCPEADFDVCGHIDRRTC
jgi:hypothetical protein